MKKSRFLLLALVFAIIVFLAGILLGVGLDELRVNDITGYLSKNEIKTESFLTEQRFVEVFGGDKCELAEPRVAELSEEIAEIGKTLTDYETRGMFRDAQYLELKII